MKCLTKLNITWDIIKPQKNEFFQKVEICTIWQKKCTNIHFLKKSIFVFFIISLVIFDLQRCIIPQINPQNNSIASFELQFCSKTHCFCTRGKGMWALFLTQTLVIEWPLLLMAGSHSKSIWSTRQPTRTTKNTTVKFFYRLGFPSFWYIEFLQSVQIMTNSP